MSTPTIQSIFIERPTAKRLAELAVDSWPVWERGVSEFSWDSQRGEVCYVLEGSVEVTSEEGTVEVGTGDLVCFPGGLRCTWKVKVPLKKRYQPAG